VFVSEVNFASPKSATCKERHLANYTSAYVCDSKLVGSHQLFNVTGNNCTSVCQNIMSSEYNHLN